MRRTAPMRARYISAALAGLMAVACTDAPTSSSITPAAEVSFSLTNKPALGPNLQGQAWVCKDDNGTGPATSFAFSVSIDGGAASTVNVPLGTCVMVHSVPTTGSQTDRVSVTEQGPPANWTFNNITQESNTPGGNPVIDLPNQNVAANITNDQGQVFTFFNTFTAPPPPPGPSCTLTQGYWKTHGGDWDAVADGKPFLTTTTFYNSGKSYLTILWTPPAGGNAYLILAHQFIAASLNLNGAAAGNAAVDAAIAGADAYFSGAAVGTPKPTGATRAQLLSWATTLDNFNNGIIGPGHCPD